MTAASMGLAKGKKRMLHMWGRFWDEGDPQEEAVFRELSGWSHSPTGQLTGEVEGTLGNPPWHRAQRYHQELQRC